MKRDTIRRVGEFVRVADAIMNAIPLTVPPQPVGLEVWDGAVLDASELHHAYNRLPASVQHVVASSYRHCLDVLTRQNHTAYAALNTRYRLFSDILVRTGISPEELVPDLHRDPHLSLVPDSPDADGDPPETTDESRADDSSDDTGLPIPFVLPVDDDPVSSMLSVSRRLPRMTGWRSAAAITLVALGCAGTLAWQHITEPAPPPTTARDALALPTPSPTLSPTLSIDMATRSNDMTATVSYEQPIAEDITELCVDLSSTDIDHDSATLTLNAVGAAPASNTGSTNPSTRHLRIDVRTRLRRDDSKQHMRQLDDPTDDQRPW